MTASADWNLQVAVRNALAADTDVIAALGGPRVFDHVPRGQAHPYLTFGQSTLRDYSTGSDTASEIVLTLHVWSRAAGRKEAATVMAAVRTALHDRSLAVADHHLVNLRHEFSDIRRDPDGEHMHGTVRFRAVVEPVA